jgi:hypothetical protein
MDDAKYIGAVLFGCEAAGCQKMVHARGQFSVIPAASLSSASEGCDQSETLGTDECALSAH